MGIKRPDRPSYRARISFGLSLILYFGIKRISHSNITVCTLCSKSCLGEPLAGGRTSAQVWLLLASCKCFSSFETVLLGSPRGLKGEGVGKRKKEGGKKDVRIHSFGRDAHGGACSNKSNIALENASWITEDLNILERRFSQISKTRRLRDHVFYVYFPLSEAMKGLTCFCCCSLPR